MLVSVRDADALGAARRRQRLRQWLRDERQSVFAEHNHHSTPRRPTMARARRGGERDEQRHGPDDSTSRGGKHAVLCAGRRWGRSAQGLVPPPPLCSYCSPYAADGGTAGESADDPLLLSSRPLTLVVDLEVPKVFSPNRVVLLLWSRSLTFQLLIVVFREVFKVFPKDGVQQRVLWSRTLTFQFPLVACVISLFLALQAHPQNRVMRVGKGFFALFRRFKKSATLPQHSVSALPPHSSPWTPAARDAL